ncbi:hypothetical protein LUZ60_013721 [Juncus effusus]|nr:hypothetical protein LUZ60_013721 [Juncus effusus]
MEHEKWSYLRDFLARNNEIDLEVYIQEIRPLETEARQCYSEFVQMLSDEFVMMLILDGCFLLEYFLKQEGAQLDGLFVAYWTEEGTDSDILLLENQLPFFIMHKLFAIYGGCAHFCEGSCPLVKLIIPFFGYGTQEPRWLRLASCNGVHHLLHLFYTCFVPGLQRENNNVVRNQPRSLVFELFFRFMSWFPQQPSASKYTLEEENDVEEGAAEESEEVEEDGEEEEAEETEEVKVKEGSSLEELDINIPCVSELFEAGVRFRRKRKPCHMFDISFQNGIMEMPLVEIGFTRKIIYSNVVAFEQSQRNELDMIFTSYMALLDALINMEKDVAVLQECGIMENLLQNEEDAAIFYNHFGDFNTMNYQEHYFRGLFIELRKYSESTWHKYRAKLMHDYFNNPWAIISIGAGGFLLILTVVQTYFSVVSGIHN